MSIFTAMREDLEKNGWRQFKLYGGDGNDGPACLQGAHARCMSRFLREGIAYRAPYLVGAGLVAAITELYPDWHHDHKAMKLPETYECYSWCVIVSFNDDAHTTIEDINRILKHAEMICDSSAAGTNSPG